jgi:NADPH:quinone reductase-like Zn-dependent oxidoreductase
MRAWQIASNFGIENLRQVDVSEAPLGAHQVRVKIHACSLNYRDLMVVLGQYNPKQPLPLIPLSDGAGEVTEVSPECKNLQVGDRVCATFSQDWCHGIATAETFKHTLGSPIDGMLAQSQVFNENGLIKFPDYMSYQEAATLPCAAVTAFNAIAFQSGLKAGDSVLIEGTGGVSLFALQFAKIFGLNPIVISSSEKKLAKTQDICPNKGINYVENEDWHTAVLDLTEGCGVDAVIDVGGAKTLKRAIASLKKGGVVCVIGVLTGSQDAIDIRPVLMNNLRIQGIFVGAKTVFEAMNRVLSRGKVHPVIDRVFGFDEVPQAFSYLKSAQHFGKICIKVAQ